MWLRCKKVAEQIKVLFTVETLGGPGQSTLYVVGGPDPCMALGGAQKLLWFFVGVVYNVKILLVPMQYPAPSVKHAMTELRSK